MNWPRVLAPSLSFLVLPLVLAAEASNVSSTDPRTESGGANSPTPTEARTWTGRLAYAPGSPVRGATMSALGTDGWARTNDRGEFALVVPVGRGGEPLPGADRPLLVSVRCLTGTRLVELPPAREARGIDLGEVVLATGVLEATGPLDDVSDEEIRLRLRAVHLTDDLNMEASQSWLEAARRGGDRWPQEIEKLRAEAPARVRQMRSTFGSLEARLAEAVYDASRGHRVAPVALVASAPRATLDPEDRLEFDLTLRLDGPVDDSAAGFARDHAWKSLLDPTRWSYEVRAVDIQTGELGPALVFDNPEREVVVSGDTRRRLRPRLDWPAPGAYRVEARARSSHPSSSWPGAPRGFIVTTEAFEVRVSARRIEVTRGQDATARSALARIGPELPAVLLEHSWREGFQPAQACDAVEQVIELGWTALPALFDALEGQASHEARAHQFALLHDVTGIDDPRDTPGVLGAHRVLMAGAEHWSLRCQDSPPTGPIAWDDAAMERVRARWLARRSWYDMQIAPDGPR